MSVIWKADLPITELQDDNSIRVEMPDDAIVLHVDVQRDRLCVWYETTGYGQRAQFRFYVIGTGAEVPVNTRHLGSVLMHGGLLVLHVFVPITYPARKREEA